MRIGPYSLQGLYPQLSLFELVGVMHGKEVAVFTPVAVDAQLFKSTSHLIVGGAADLGALAVIVVPRTPEQFLTRGIFVGDHKPRVSRRGALGSALAVDQDNTCIGVHFCQRMRGRQTGESASDNQPVGPFGASQTGLHRTIASLHDPAAPVLSHFLTSCCSVLLYARRMNN
ncbi:hypothetical protein D3C80_337570 [compost metagenome]